MANNFRDRRGGFHRRRKIIGRSFLGAALLAVVLAVALVGIRAALPGEEVGGSGDGSPDGSRQELASSQGSTREEGKEPEAADDGDGSAESAKKDEDPRSTSGMEKLGEYETDYRYSDSEARKNNLEKSAAAVNGTVVSPGETFSMNEHLIGVDYEKAKVFADGGESEALGGGLCQVTSTVYMAAQNAGMDIVERHPHYTVLSYIRPGFDATVWFGGAGIAELDMKFENTTDSNILVREYITKDGILKAEIWGQPNGKQVTMRSEQDFKDTSRGIKWSTYKTVKEDGEVIQQGKIYEDLYSFPPPESIGDEGYNDVRVGGW